MFDTLPQEMKIILASVLVGIIVVIVSSIVFRSFIRRLIVRIAEIFALLSVVLGSLMGGFSAYTWSIMTPNRDYSVLIGILGALGSFIGLAILFAFLFVLIDIAESTRKQVAFFQNPPSHNLEAEA